MATPFTKILVGWDASPGAVKGLQLALELAACDTGSVTALAVVPALAHVEDATARARALEQARAPLREAFDAVVRASKLAPGEHASLEFAEGVDAGKAVDRYTAAHSVKLVVVGLHGQEGLLHPKMGHVASHAVQVSRCPVLVVPDDADAAHYPDPAQDSHGSSLFHPFRRHHSTG